MRGFIVTEGITSIFYHGSCPDGIIAREVLKLKFQGIRMIPYYFQELKEIPENALFIDCSPKSFQVKACLDNGCCIAEHHNSFVSEPYIEEYPGQLLIGDTDKAESGARLAMNIVGGVSEAVECLVSLIAISDTWQKEEPSFELARMYAGYVAFFGNDFSMNLEQFYHSDQMVRAFGKVQQRKQENLAKCAMREDFGGMKLAFINELNMSNAAEILRSTEDIDIVIGYLSKFDNGKNITIYSLRSKESGFDCSTFAKSMGGGGHKAAAGFSIDLDYMSPIDNFENILANWLSK